MEFKHEYCMRRRNPSASLCLSERRTCRFIGSDRTWIHCIIILSKFYPSSCHRYRPNVHHRTVEGEMAKLMKTKNYEIQANVNWTLRFSVFFTINPSRFHDDISNSYLNLKTIEKFLISLRSAKQHCQCASTMCCLSSVSGHLRVCARALVICGCTAYSMRTHCLQFSWRIDPSLHHNHSTFASSIQFSVVLVKFHIPQFN